MKISSTQLPIAISDKLYRINGIVCRAMKIVDLTYYQPAPVEEVRTPIQWSGGLMTSLLWSQILGFLQETYDMYKAETLVRLYYNHENKSWKALVHKQIVTRGAMTISDSLDDAMLNTLGVGYVPFGSVHHHCTASAFQSATDLDSELRWDGVHITVGNMDKPAKSYHTRFCVEGQMIECPTASFIETHEAIRAVELLYPNDEVTQQLRDKYFANIQRGTPPAEWLSQVAVQGVHGLRPTNGLNYSFQANSLFYGADETSYKPTYNDIKSLFDSCKSSSDSKTAKNMDRLLNMGKHKNMLPTLDLPYYPDEQELVSFLKKAGSISTTDVEYTDSYGLLLANICLLYVDNDILYRYIQNLEERWSCQC